MRRNRKNAAVAVKISQYLSHRVKIKNHASCSQVYENKISIARVLWEQLKRMGDPIFSQTIAERVTCQRAINSDESKRNRLKMGLFSRGK